MKIEIGKAISIPYKHGAKGCEVLKLQPTLGFYYRKNSERVSVVPTATYCPSCSSLNEYDRRSGKVRPKFQLKEYDLNFDLSYREEDGQLYGKCDKCGFDLRNDVIEEELYKEEDKQRAYRDIRVEKPIYRNGNYYVSLQDFAKVAKEFAQGSRIKLCIEQKIGPKINLYRMSDEAYNQLNKFDRSSTGLLGIPRKFWERAV